MLFTLPPCAHSDADGPPAAHLPACVHTQQLLPDDAAVAVGNNIGSPPSEIDEPA